MDKNYNTFTKKLRFIQYNIFEPNIKSQVYYDYFTYESFYRIDKKKYQFENLNLTPYNYRPYIFFLIFWFLKRNFFIINQTKHTTTKKIIIELSILIIGTVIGYAIIKFIFHWV